MTRAAGQADKGKKAAAVRPVRLGRLGRRRGPLAHRTAGRPIAHPAEHRPAYDRIGRGL